MFKVKLITLIKYRFLTTEGLNNGLRPSARTCYEVLQGPVL